MEEKRISLRVPPALHMEAKMRMLKEWGEDNFQKLLMEYLESYVNASAAATKSSKQSTQASKSVFDELSEIDPQSAAEFVPLLQSALRRAKELQNARPVRTVPAEANASSGTATRKTKTG